MRAMVRLVLLGLGVVALTGCASGTPAGTWKMISIEPESARGQFAFGTITFEADGTYSADAAYGGEAKHMTGTYALDPANKRVTFTGASGPEHSYHINYCRGCGTMEVWNDGPERRWEAKMKRTK